MSLLFIFSSLGDSADKGDSQGGSLKIHTYMLASSDPGCHRPASQGGVSREDPHPTQLGQGNRLLAGTCILKPPTVPQWLEQMPHYRKLIRVKRQKDMSQNKGQDKNPRKATK